MEDPQAITEETARRIADAFLASLRFDEQLVVVGSSEAPRSWVFATGFASGERGFGNAPVVVDKRSGAVRFSREADIEFYDAPTTRERLRRFFYRRLKY